MNTHTFEPVPHISRDGLLVISPHEAMRRLQESVARSNPTRPAPLTTVRWETVADDVVMDLNPHRRTGDIVALLVAFEGTAAVRVGAREICRLTVMPPGTEPNSHVTLDEVEIIAADSDIGFDDDGAEVSDEWKDQGWAAVNEVLAHRPPMLGLHVLGRTPEALDVMAVFVGRRYGLTFAELAERVGHPVEARRSLLKPGGMAKALTMARAKERAYAEREAAEQRARFEEERRVNTSTLGELGFEGVSIPHDGITQVPLALQARAAFVVGDATLILWPTLAPFGLELPHVEFAGCRVLARDFVPALPARALEGIRGTTVEEHALTLAVRRRFMSNVDRGPIAPERWTRAGEDAARKLAAEWAHIFYTSFNGLAWIPKAVVIAGVRGGLVRPDRLTAIVWDECTATHSRMHGERARPIRGSSAKPIGSIPSYENLLPKLESKAGAFFEPDPLWTPPTYAGAVSLQDIAQWCAEAAAGGEVEPGSLIATNDTTKKKGPS